MLGRLLLLARLVDGHLCGVRRWLLLPGGLVVGVPGSGADRLVYRRRRRLGHAVPRRRLLRRGCDRRADAVHVRLLLRDRRPQRSHRAVQRRIHLRRGRLARLVRAQPGRGLGRRRPVRGRLFLPDWQRRAGRVPDWLFLRGHRHVARHAVHARLLLRNRGNGGRPHNAVPGRVLLPRGRDRGHAMAVPGRPLLPGRLADANTVRGPSVPRGGRVDRGQHGVPGGLLLPRVFDVGAAGRVPARRLLSIVVGGAHAVHAGLRVHDGHHVVGHGVAMFGRLLLPHRLVQRHAEPVPARFDVFGWTVGADAVHGQ